ncbi:MAG: RdgB/HAM1 family non-canonical purine NTP pyrophosphatase [Azoarcus sp.]|jgi:XTP/dITP diphosphohydrolase|nr:RdgB/HAM1 family non-canonical purine NTP pyrophosphatase [Azoarcus sp.]
MKKLIVASNNSGKLRELNALLAPLGWETLPQQALGLPECEEPYLSFVENALAKARHAAILTGLPALADDSGLCVHALGGAPGVHSARYAGEPKSDRRNNERLIVELAGKADRRAHYVCALAFVRHADDPQPIITEGEWHGEIVDSPRGEGGFGYDPYFFLPEDGLTVAQLDAAEKNRRSHRGQALALLADRLKNRRA